MVESNALLKRRTPKGYRGFESLPHRASIVSHLPTFGARLALGVALFLAGNFSSRAASFLFDAAHAQTAGNADWVIDQDAGGPQRFPTPDQATVTATTPENYWKGGISAWGIELVKRGHQVETLPASGVLTYQNAGNAQDLSRYQVLVIDEPNKAFTAAERTAIVNWVKAGGSLFLIADHTGSDRNGDGKDSVMIWNELFASNGVQAAPFGLVINSDSLSPRNESVDGTAGNPITRGIAGTITQFNYADGASLTIDPTKNASVKGAVWASSTRTNSNVLVAYGTFGAGKFVAIGDSSPMDDGTGAAGDVLYDGWTDAGGNNGQLVINASLWLATPLANAPPPNDTFLSAAALAGPTPSATGTNVNATKETGEPNHGGNAGGKSVWWKWTAPSSGTVTLTTSGSNFDTLLGVYTGGAVNALTLVAGNDNSGPGLTSSVTFSATAGLVYALAVDGNGGAAGSIALALTLTAPPTGGTPVAFASWNFDSTPYANPLPANSGSATLDFSGWGGTVTNFGGVTGQALALQGTAGNGTYIELAFSMSGYRGLKVDFATRGTATGFSSGIWSWSVNGGAFTTLPGVNTGTTTTSFVDKTVDFSGQTALDHAASVRLRYTLSGSSGSSPNVRIDDLVLSATQVPVVSVVVTNADAFEAGMQPATVVVSSSLAAGSGGLPVSFQLGGSASASDYSLAGNSSANTVTIPAGATSAMLTFTPIADGNLTEFDESITLALVQSAGYFLGTPAAASLTIHDDTPYNATWAAAHPGFQGALADPMADPDADGISNLEEFAYNGDPFRSDRSILPAIAVMEFPDPADGNLSKPYPTISFLRRTDAPDLVYAVEISDDLRNWTNELEQISATPDAAPNMERVVYRGLTPLRGNGAKPRVFLRVRVSF